MSTYYKATRPNGTDFYTGRVQYRVGGRARPLPSGGRVMCGPGVLHAADVPAETIVGGRWPCRLFEVSGRPVMGFNKQHPHKGGFKQLVVVQELDAQLALGPNGAEVAALIERARTLTAGELKQLAATRDGAQARAIRGDAAWDAARDTAWVAARDAARDAARAAARDAAWGAARATAWDGAWGAARGVAGAHAATWDAAVALVVKDLLSREHFDKLYGSWASVVGKPVLW